MRMHISYKDSRLKTSIVFYYYRDTCSITYNDWVDPMFYDIAI